MVRSNRFVIALILSSQSIAGGNPDQFLAKAASFGAPGKNHSGDRDLHCAELDALFKDDAEGASMWSAWKQCYQNDPAGNLDSPADNDTAVVFNANLIWIRKRNKLLKESGKSLRFGLNKFSAMTLDEFVEATSMKGSPLPSNNTMDDNETLTLQGNAPWKGRPAGTEWDGTNCILPHASVKDQGNCGTCWLFASAGAAEQSLALHMQNKDQSPPPDLSVQYLIDCTKAKDHCEGGGWPNDGAGWISDLGKVPSDGSYQYHYDKSMCTDDSVHKCPIVNTCDGAKGYNIGQRIAARYEQGGWPFHTWKHMMGGDNCDSFQSYGYAISMCTKSDGFHNYESGVMSDCSNKGCDHDYLNINHAMLIVGWGVLSGEKYWYVRNSWGTGWGLKGYIMLARETGGTGCAGINMVSAQFLGITD